ncbi:MAG TPA: indolepyruvate oxidoreductase subunit beta [candidate division WOR-3 bacterium]|uniref:Indolepyruvate oxidoreductase subunit beta n=1 Tax=candidate division WOR-3 bacterium TaxID=2052148 RepID=A0A9C9EMD7_UNCW3|nr:indolepyruvate oxidoreductase subunit beta [candidate division WOR-3 bacterium]
MENKKVTNIVICGVGGQGIILASNVLCNAAFNERLDVKKSEVHGMAQRGGSVITHVRFGEKVYSPLIEEGKVDFILAFEKLEAFRYLHYLKEKNGVIIVNDREIPPMSVLVGADTYPADITKKLKNYGELHLVPAEKTARELKNSRTVNIILLGVLSTFLNFKTRSWHSALKSCIKEKFVELNISAFDRGRALRRE